MSKRGRNQPDQRADTRGGRFVGLPHAVIESVAYRHVSPFARAVLIEVLARFNGYNNGAIGVSQRELAAALATSNFGRIGRSIAELMAAGLLDVTAEGAWKERAAREYRLTFISTGKPPHARPATNEYLGWAPPAGQSGDGHRSAGKGKSAEHPSAAARKSAEHLSARVAGKARKSVVRQNEAAEHPSSLIGKPYPSPSERVGLPNRSHTPAAGASAPADAGPHPDDVALRERWAKVRAINNYPLPMLAELAEITDVDWLGRYLANEIDPDEPDDQADISLRVSIGDAIERVSFRTHAYEAAHRLAHQCLAAHAPNARPLDFNWLAGIAEVDVQWLRAWLADPEADHDFTPAPCQLEEIYISAPRLVVPGA